MKKNTVVEPSIIDDRVVETVKEQLVLEAKERFDLFRQTYENEGWKIEISFTEKLTEFYLKFLETNRTINELDRLPQPCVCCTVTLFSGNELVLSTTADAPLSYTMPYKSSETMALNTLFDRMGIESIVHKHTLTSSGNESVKNEQSIDLLSSTNLPVDFDTIPQEDVENEKQLTPSTDNVVSLATTSITNDDADNMKTDTVLEPENLDQPEPQISLDEKKEIEGSSIDEDLTGEVEPDGETEAVSESDNQSELSLTLDCHSNMNDEMDIVDKEPHIEADQVNSSAMGVTTTSQQKTGTDFPSDLPLPFHSEVQTKLELQYGNDWASYMPKTKKEAYELLGVPTSMIN